MKKLACALALLLTLAACAHEPRGPRPQGGASARSEKSVIRALTDLKVDEPQRLAVLAAFDRDNGERRRVGEQRESAQRSIAMLDRRDADYLQRLEPLARQIGDATAASLILEARFEQSVSQTLSEAQWSDWQDYFFRQSGPGGGEGGRMRGSPPE